MAKKTKDAAAVAKDEAKAEAKAKAKAKPKAPADPIKTRNLIRLLNILALLLAIAAFLLQLFAVISHHWKWQKTDLRSIISPNYHYSQPNVHEDSRLDQNYGLYSREVKVYGNNDEQVDVLASTRFPRVDEGEQSLHQCLSGTSTLRGAFLTCSNRVASSQACYCRRHAYWNWVSVFEITALVLLGIVVFLVALLTTQFHGLLKLAGAGLALLAFIFILVGLILILSYLKRETRSFADIYPHIYRRLTNQLSTAYGGHRPAQRSPTVLHQAIRRQTHEVYRAFPLLPGQHPFNDTHYQEYSDQVRNWVYRPYVSSRPQVVPVPYVQRPRITNPPTTRRTTTTAPLYSEYGPAIGYDTVYDNTRAGIGWSTVLSILAMVLALLLPLILIFSWLTAKKLGTDVKTVTTTVKTEYVPVPQDVTVETIPPRPIPVDYDPRRPIGDAVVTTQNVRQTPHDIRSEPVIVRDVVIRDDVPVSGTSQEHSYPVNVGTTYRS
jgi:hypothetical protein